MSNKKIVIVIGILCLLDLTGCNKFNRNGWLSSFGYNIDECERRDRTHHYSRYKNGTSPGRINIQARKYRCRIERICLGKSEAENKKCKVDAGSYWGFTEENQVYKILKRIDDESDAICSINPSHCSTKWHPQENYSTNPYWNQKTKSYILPKSLKKD